MPVISRFAPAPTGHLHLGHVVNALFVWGVTRGLGGQVILRIEDHDRRRSRREYEASILEDLDWLGFEADGPPVRQRERGSVYEAALESLRSRGLVYACECSRSDIAARASVPQAPGADLQLPLEIPYPGTCAAKGLKEEAGLGLRVRIGDAVERFVDGVHGPLEHRPAAQCGDLLVRDRDGDWTYQFAAAVDDFDQGVTLVVRGDDLLASTGRQIALARMLGRQAPARFLHHPLIMRSATAKLSKSNGDTGVRELRLKGWSREDVMGRAAAGAGLVESPRPLDRSEAAGLVVNYVDRKR